MGLDLSKLKNVKTAAGKTTARCPACAAAGGDAKGDHLVIYADGRYGCVANPEAKAHAKEIFRHAGQGGTNRESGKITVRAVNVPTSSVLMDLRGFERFAKAAPTPRPQPAATPETLEPKAKEVPLVSDVVLSSAPRAEGKPLPIDESAVSQEEKPPLIGAWVDLDGRPVGSNRLQRITTDESPWLFLGVSEEEFNAAAAAE